MKCVNHPEAEAEVLCASCKAPICGECRVQLRDRDLCKTCLEERFEALEYHTHKNKLLAFLLSLVPGAGYMYLGLMNRGLQTMVFFFGTIFVTAMTRIEPLLPLVLPVILFYNVFDTLQLAGRINGGVKVEDRPLVDLGSQDNWQNILGYALVVLGALALLNNLVPYVFYNYHMINKIISPLIIIAIGVFILYRSLGRGKENGGKGDV